MARVQLAVAAQTLQALPLPTSGDWWTWPTAVYYASATEAQDLGVPADYPCYIFHLADRTAAVKQIAEQLRGAGSSTSPVAAPTWERWRHGTTESTWVQR